MAFQVGLMLNPTRVKFSNGTPVETNTHYNPYSKRDTLCFFGKLLYGIPKIGGTFSGVLIIRI